MFVPVTHNCSFYYTTQSQMQHLNIAFVLTDKIFFVFSNGGWRKRTTTRTPWSSQWKRKSLSAIRTVTHSYEYAKLRGLCLYKPLQ